MLRTGTRPLTGFLLTAAFQPVFPQLEPWQRVLHLAVVSPAVLSTVLVLMPVAPHRGLFRRRAMRDLVERADRTVRIGLVSTGLAIVGVLALVVSAAAGAAGSIAAAAVGSVLIAALPLSLRRGRPKRSPQPERALET